MSYFYCMCYSNSSDAGSIIYKINKGGSKGNRSAVTL